MAATMGIEVAVAVAAAAAAAAAAACQEMYALTECKHEFQMRINKTTRNIMVCHVLLR